MPTDGRDGHMTLAEATKRLATLYTAAKGSTKIKTDPLVWALKQVLALAERENGEVRKNG